jgi:hypothetical protein
MSAQTFVTSTRFWLVELTMGRVFAFEPHPETLQLQRRKVSQIGDGDVGIENVALSDMG